MDKGRKKDTRKGDRHKNRKKYPSKKPAVKLAGIDGEAVVANGLSYYSLLGVSGRKPLLSVIGEKLTTAQILDYIINIPKHYRLVGFVLNYDIENWLCDIPKDAYMYLTGSMAVDSADDWCKVKAVKDDKQTYARNTIMWNGYTIFWIPKKVFELKKGTKKVKILDIWGYCQESFVDSVKSWKVATDEEVAVVRDGKASRSDFVWDDMDTIIKYNTLELDLLVRLADKIIASCQKGIGSLGKKIPVTYHELYSPGAIAGKLLKRSGWVNDVGVSALDTEHFLTSFESLTPEHVTQLQRLPFIASYYGGRIETAAVGKWVEAWDYDIKSAYPTAITRFPSYVKVDKAYYVKDIYGDSKKLETLIKNRSMGMYLVSWDFGSEGYWNPFPYRTDDGNVLFPPLGSAWVCSPEVFAAIDTGKKFNILEAIIIPDTDGFGGGEKPLQNNHRNSLAGSVIKLFDERKTFAEVDGKGGAELAIKLILTAIYGKLLQQVGRNLDELKLFNDFISTWITSWTRAAIWRAIADVAHTRQILSVHTDGLISTKQLNVKIGMNLGEWEEKKIKNLTLLMPGVYKYGEGSIVERTRGMPKGFDFDLAHSSMFENEKPYEYTYSSFIGRRIVEAQHNVYGDHCHQWVKSTKIFTACLSSKREDGAVVLKSGEVRKWTKPKRIFTGNISSPFVLNFDVHFWIPRSQAEIESVLLQESDEGGIGFFRE